MLLNEVKIKRIIKSLINEIVMDDTTIHLQFIDGYFYPVDSISSERLKTELNLGRIPENRFDFISPRLVKLGYKLAIDNYEPKQYNNPYEIPTRNLIDREPKKLKNPCTKCNLNGLCDSDGCGKHHFRLFK